jgi:hypothetical protein
MKNGGTIRNCYTVTDVAALYRAGGIVGDNSNGIIINCLSASFVSANLQYEGAIAGVGASGIYKGCFYDINKNPAIFGVGDVVGDPCGIIGGDTNGLNHLYHAQTYIDACWDIVTPSYIPERYIWRMCADNVNYPVLSCQFLSGDFVCGDGVDIMDLAAFADEWILEIFDVEVDFHVDGHIDLKDWAILAAAWRSENGQERFNASVDIVSDGVINELDIALFTEYWLAYGAYHLNADLTPYGGDGIVDMYDYAVFAEQWYKDR